MASVEFYFDYSCPWSYLACVRLVEAATRTGSTIIWRPVVLEQVLEMASPGQAVAREPADSRKATYQIADIEAWADYVGIPINRPDDWPADSGLAAAGGVVADQMGLGKAYSEAVFSAYFGADRNIADAGVLADLAVDSGIERHVFERELAGAGCGEVIAGNIETLLKRGGFGAPTMFVGEHMFFGNDRMPLVEFALGQSSGREFVMPGQHG